MYLEQLIIIQQLVFSQNYFYIILQNVLIS